MVMKLRNMANQIRFTVKYTHLMNEKFNARDYAQLKQNKPRTTCRF